MIEERGILVDRATIYRRTQRYVPVEREAAALALAPTTLHALTRGRGLMRFRGAGHACSVHQRRGHPIDSISRQYKAAKRFLSRALCRLAASEHPKVVDPDKGRCCGPAIDALKKGCLPKNAQHRQARCLNDRLDLTRAKLKSLSRPVLGLQPLRPSYASIKGLKVIRPSKKEQGSAPRHRLGSAASVWLPH